MHVFFVYKGSLSSYAASSLQRAVIRRLLVETGAGDASSTSSTAMQQEVWGYARAAGQQRGRKQAHEITAEWRRALNPDGAWGIDDSITALAAVLFKQLSDQRVFEQARTVSAAAAQCVRLGTFRHVLARMPPAEAALRAAAAAAADAKPFWREQWLAARPPEELEGMAQLCEAMFGVAHEFAPGSRVGDVTLRQRDGACAQGLRIDRARFAVVPEQAYPLLSVAVDMRGALLADFPHACDYSEAFE